MAFTSGTKLGPYEIVSPAGAGGMGEVYKARDTRLDRTVAIKVLSARLGDRPDLQKRLEREARTISKLAHPHICALYDIGQQEGVDFLVMEYLEGETLSHRLQRGSLPVEQTLKYGIEIAEALETAHRQGIIHRDLKPGNVMLTKAGAKLMDFGLAKLAEQPAPVAVALSEMADAPTLPSEEKKLTDEGVVVGTFQYMAPEQLEGKEADARTDLFALGVVLYEMATGRPAFTGKTKASVIAAILSSDPPPVSSLQPLTPLAFDRVVKTCLAKDPEERFETAHDVKLELKWVAEGGSQVGMPAVAVKRRRLERRALLAALAVTTLVAILALSGLWLRKPAPAPPVVRTSLLPPEGHSFGTGQLALSPDGTRVAFRGWILNGSVGSLWIQDLATGTAHEVPGTPDAYDYFWSPDSKWLGFSAGGKLQKVEAAGGPIITLVEQGATGNSTWSPDGSILYEGLWTLHRVAAAGGPVTDVTLAETQGWRVQYPVFLPDGRHFLFYRVPGAPAPRLSQAAGGGAEQPGIYVGDVKTSTQRFVAASQGERSAVVAGWLFYSREGTLMAQPFDASGLAPTGEPIPIGQVSDNAWSVSPAGTLAYFAGDAATSAPELSELLWYSRNGKQEGRFDTTRPFQFVRLSPDGQRLAAEIRDDAAKNSNIWVFELQRGIATRITSDKANESCPVWAPDGKRIVFDSDAAGHGDLHVKAASGFGQEEVLLASASNKVPSDWSHDGRNIAYTDVGGDQIAVALWNTDEAKSHLLIDKSSGTAHNEMARFSPDGKWLAYQVGLPRGSGDVGKAGRRHEIFVVPFPTLAERWQVSRDGGEQPVWRPDGKELYWMSLNNKLMAASVTVKGNGLTFGAPVELFQTRAQITDCGGQYDVTPDGKRFLVISAISKIETAPKPLTVVTNWTALLRK